MSNLQAFISGIFVTPTGPYFLVGLGLGLFLGGALWLSEEHWHWTAALLKALNP